MDDEIYVLIEHLRAQVAEITYSMLSVAGSLAEKIGCQVTAVLLGYQVQELADDLAAQRVVYIDDPALADFIPEAYQRVLTVLLKENQPRLVLLGDTSIGAEVAGCLSARLNLPLVSYCRDVFAEDGRLCFTSLICGGKLTAQGDLPEPTALVTMTPGAFKPEQGHSSKPKEIVPFKAPDLTGLQVALKQYIEPQAGDVDISKEPILVSIGRGIQNQDNISLAEELAKVLGGVVSASRPVVDQGWLPTTRLVGKSGKSVRPKLYLALGISGAPEHVEAITGSEMIIAINTDPAAPIFNIAKYGAEVDLLELLPVLSEKLRAIKVM